ncbi:MAG: phosphoribosylanthranilate isomerase [Deltaproteobacteria bacterium HGW-Deltaproteobacteria-12]|jgi:phosphoribosylanthranilate isomerase|nr:MAG: phosphoribosylanthranilate isomerase [Deltaproteobacteria bacterium HGW-Deltaproteobacteria-12]
MTQIKICGITNAEDALCAAGCGADALGFIFYRKSPRYISPIQARQIIRKLPAGIARIGVFVNESAAEVKRIYELCNLDFIQLHGDESAEYCSCFAPEMLIKAVALHEEHDLQKSLNYHVAALLVDSRRGGLYGGTGRKANWDLALRIKNKKPLILSGGLNEENIKAALEKVAPQALDINSGVEIKPGRKDHKKIARLCKIVQSVDFQPDNTPFIFTVRGNR